MTNAPIDPVRPDLDRLQRTAFIVAGAGIVVAAIGAFTNSAEFMLAYLLGFMFWLGVALGCMGLLMLHHMVSGSWGFVMQRVLEAATRTLPLLLILVIPILIAAPSLYEWARPDMVAADPILREQSGYLNLPFVIIRTAIYFGIWLTIAYFLNRWSLEQDRTGDATYYRRIQSLSGPGLVIYVVSMTFAAVDWVMSLQPHWISTIFGLLGVVGQALAALTFTILVMRFLFARDPMREVLRAQNFHDMGNLTFALIMLWAYMSFSQFLIIWSGNLPEETPFYLRRINGGWEYVALALVLFHFFLPFFALLMRPLKRRVQYLSIFATLIFIMRLVDLFWAIVPAHHEKSFHIHYLYLVVPVAMGGLWFAVFLWQLKTRSLLPIGDPRLVPALETVHEH